MTAPALLAALLALPQLGCLDRPLASIVPCASRGFVSSVSQEGVNKVDLLFMIDNSGSMLEEQTTLSEQFPKMVRALVTGDRLGNNPTDGSAPTREQLEDDFPAVRDLHIGVVTSDLGVFGTSNLQGCSGLPRAGGDGLLAQMGTHSNPACGASSPTFLSFKPANGTSQSELLTEADALAAQFACLGDVGVSGCGIEQQLEAPLKALTPSGSAIKFAGNSSGHGDTENAGFLRDEALLAVVLVTDEEDCSMRDPSALYGPGFNGSRDPMHTHENVRCAFFQDALHPIERYVDGLRELKPDHPEHVVFAAIAGIPTDLASAPDQDIAFDAILADPRMQYVGIQQNGLSYTKLAPSCVAPSNRGDASPPRRIVEVARKFGSNNATLQSICNTDFTPALLAIVDKIATGLIDICVPRPIHPDDQGTVACDVIAKLAAPGSPAAMRGTPSRCVEIPGCENGDDDACLVSTTPVRTENGAEYCRIKQVPVQRSYTDDGNVVGTFNVDAAGWYYDDFSPQVQSVCSLYQKPQRIAFTERGLPPGGSIVSLECLQRVQTVSGVSSARGVELGTYCDPSQNMGENGQIPTNTACNGTVSVGGRSKRLFCDPGSRSCQLDCQTDADCPASLVCDASNAQAIGTCINPVCS